MKYAYFCLSPKVCTNITGCLAKMPTTASTKNNNMNNSSPICCITTSWVQCQLTNLCSGTCLLLRLPLTVCVYVCVCSFRSRFLPSLLFRNECGGKNTDLRIGKPGFKKCPYCLFFEWTWEILVFLSPASSSKSEWVILTLQHLHEYEMGLCVCPT